jgi:phosphate-selective porin OprO/OprP
MQVAVSLIVATAPTSAQSVQPPAGTAPPFVLQSDDGDNRLQPGAVVNFDGRFFTGPSEARAVDTFQVRRLRAQAEGHVARHFPFLLNVDFAGGVVNLRDAWFETRFSDGLHVRVGKFRAPFSYDRLTRVAHLMFVERGLTTTVAPDRETGVQVLGDLASGRLSYAGALTNGVIDGGTADLDANGAKDLTGRVMVRPWATRATHRLQGLGLALAVNTGIQPGPLPSFQLPGRQVYFTYAEATGEGRRTRWSPQGFYYHGPFGGYAEYVHSEGAVRRGTVRGDVAHQAWQAAASWVVTGEPAVPERNVRPRYNFDPATHHYGALQVAARYQVLAVGADAVELGFASPISSRRADVLTIGLNWYLNPFVKWNLNVEHTAFERTASSSRPDENAILLRGHLGF